MESDAQPEKRQAHAYLDRLSEAQLSAVRGLLEAMLDPAARALANAPVDDEPVTEEELHAVAEARESRKRNGGIPFKEVVAEPVRDEIIRKPVLLDDGHERSLNDPPRLERVSSLQRASAVTPLCAACYYRNIRMLHRPLDTIT